MKTFEGAFPQLVNGELQCERCRKLERQGMDVCVRTDCPYKPVRTPSNRLLGSFLFIVLFVLLVFGPLVFVPASADTTPLNWLVIILLSALTAVGGVYAFAGSRIILFNRNTGTGSWRVMVFNREVSRKMILPIERLNLRPRPTSDQRYPISAAILRYSMQGVFNRRLRANATDAKMMCVATISDLAARGYLTIWRAQATKSTLFGRKTDTEYIILLGETVGQPLGWTEKRFMAMVRSGGWGIKRPDQRQDAYALIYSMFERAVNSPAKALIEIAEGDARPDLPGGEWQNIRDRAHRWYRQVILTHPEFVPEAIKQVTRALEARTVKTD